MLYCLGYKFRAIVRTDVSWFAPLTEQPLQGHYHVLGSDRALRLMRQALPAVLVHYGHDLQPPTGLRSVHREVVAPDVVDVFGASPGATILGGSQPPSFAFPTTGRHL